MWVGSKTAPWQGQKRRPEGWSYSTVQPCVRADRVERHDGAVGEPDEDRRIAARRVDEGSAVRGFRLVSVAICAGRRGRRTPGAHRGAAADAPGCPLRCPAMPTGSCATWSRPRKSPPPSPPRPRPRPRGRQQPALEQRPAFRRRSAGIALAAPSTPGTEGAGPPARRGRPAPASASPRHREGPARSSRDGRVHEAVNQKSSESAAPAAALAR